MPRRVAAITVLVGLLLSVAVPALAHVEATVDDPHASATAAYTLSVPNERTETDTVRIEVQLPDGLSEVVPEPPDGWSGAVDGGVLTFDGGTIPPGEELVFAFSARNPATPETLTFPTIQTYSDGEEVSWIGKEGESDEPAPTVEIVAAAGSPAPATSESGSSSSPDASATPTPAGSPSVTTTATDVASPVATGSPTTPEPATSSGAGNGGLITIVVLIVLVVGGAVVVWRRRGAS